MITELTPEQIERMGEHRDWWVARALRTDWNPERVREVIPQVYEIGNLKPPKHVLLVDSPRKAALAVSAVIDLDVDPTEAEKYVEQNPQAEYQWKAPDDGAGWVGWRAFYSFFLNEFEIGRELAPYYELDKAGAFWWYLYDEMFVACAPPLYMRFDEGDVERGIAYRYHCEDGPALEWPDGYKLYFWKGIGIPGWWIEDKSRLTAEYIFKLENTELRRTAGEILGWENILSALGGEVIQKDNFGSLIQVTLPGADQPSKFVKVVDPSTGRTYYNPVPPNMQTCHAGVAWRFGFEKPEDYNPAIQS